MTIPIASRPITMRHLITMTDDRGIFEHAKFAQPRYSHGYCTDDNARLLVVASRDEGRSFASRSMAHIAMRFLLDAQCDDGGIRNRLSIERIWMDEPCNHDCWGRALWGFGTAVSHNHDNVLTQQGLNGFERSARLRSTSMRTMAFAALGAAEVINKDPGNAPAMSLLRDAADVLASAPEATTWLWPEARLSYANAVIPEALMATGHAISEPQLFHYGLDLLSWLVTHESHEDHFSVTPTGGRGPGDTKPAFDQQPIEVAAIADAVARAWRLTGDTKWRVALDRAIHWFLGHNDTGAIMIDPMTDGCYDGLQENGVNYNEGAESTLAMISTMQYVSMNGTLLS